MPISEETISRYIEKTDELDATVRQLTHSVDRVDEKQQDLRDIMVEIKQGQTDMIAAFRESISNVHKRVDDIHDDKTLAKGVEKGRAEQRVVMLKWIGGVVGLIAIVGYVNRADATQLHPAVKQEAVAHERRHNDQPFLSRPANPW
jgi:hypothetical protein